MISDAEQIRPVPVKMDTLWESARLSQGQSLFTAIKGGEEPMAKVAVITGSNGLIGQATCRRLGQCGHLAVE